jgi:hypothetical protein
MILETVEARGGLAFLLYVFVYCKDSKKDALGEFSFAKY